MPRIPILAGVVPDSSGEVYGDRFDIHATNDVWDLPVLVMEDGTTRTGCHGGFAVPSDYGSGANLVIIWTTAATSGDVEFDFDYRSIGGDDTESLDQATAQESVNSNDTAPSAAFERMVLTISLTDGNFFANDFVTFFFARDKSDAGDTLADEALVFGLYFEYTAA